MKNHKEFDIPFIGLKQGEHVFDYTIAKEFFESFEYDDFNSAAVSLKATLHKTSTVMELDMDATGTVNVDCDLTAEPFEQPILGHLELVIKFGEEFNDDDDEILIVPHGAHTFNIAQYVYEMLVLAVPQKRVHPGVLDGSFKSKALDRLRELAPKEVKETKEEIDPRWDVLKKLITDK